MNQFPRVRFSARLLKNIPSVILSTWFIILNTWNLLVIFFFFFFFFLCFKVGGYLGVLIFSLQAILSMMGQMWLQHRFLSKWFLIIERQGQQRNITRYFKRFWTSDNKTLMDELGRWGEQADSSLVQVEIQIRTISDKQNLNCSAWQRCALYLLSLKFCSCLYYGRVVFIYDVLNIWILVSTMHDITVWVVGVREQRVMFHVFNTDIPQYVCHELTCHTTQVDTMLIALFIPLSFLFDQHSVSFPPAWWNCSFEKGFLLD